MPRQTQFKKPVRDEMIRLARLGQCPTVAATNAGIHRSTLTRWRKRADEDRKAGKRSAYVRFIEQLDQAHAQALGDLEQTIHSTAKQDWRAGAFILERRLPDQYGRKDQIRIQIDDALRSLLDDVEPHMTDDAYDQLINAIGIVRGEGME